MSQEFIDQCPVEHGFRLRGKAMTRIEVFVDAALAFAVTLLVISFDEMPRSYDEMVAALKDIPAFVFAVAQIIWIWAAHSTWSRRFGLEDAATVILSAALLVVVLVYVYPLRVMADGMFARITGGRLPSEFELTSYEQLRFMLGFMGIGFATLCTLFMLFHAHARHRANDLRLSGSERYDTQTLQLIWALIAAIGMLAVLLALLLPDRWVPYSAFSYALIPAGVTWLARRRGRFQGRRLT